MEYHTLEVSASNEAPLLSLVLFGSEARGSAGIRSDIDLLAVTESGQGVKTVAGRAVLYTYSLSQLKGRASNGDLFLWHVVEEGIPLTGQSIWESICEEFQLRNSYREHIRSHGSLGLAEPLRQKRSFHAREIAIAKLAEERTPIFDKSYLVERFPDMGSDAFFRRAASL